MHALRTTSSLTRLVLAWFVLTLAVAAGSPLVRAQSMEVVCTVGSSAKLLVAGSDGTLTDAGRHTLDCPLCLMADAPPSREVPAAATPLLWDRAPEPVVGSAHRVASVGAPLPARGPPTLN